MPGPLILDCTLRDGGYHNLWDFSPSLIQEYLNAVAAAGVDVVELGFRSLKTDGFKGGCAYSTDTFIEQFFVPPGVELGVMVNAAECLTAGGGVDTGALARMFAPAAESRVSLVRSACHIHEFAPFLPAADRLHEMGYRVGLNLMQVADRSPAELRELARRAADHPIEVLYFADSLGGLTPESLSEVVRAFRDGWSGDLGVHTHDNMSMALVNSVRAVEEGVRWVDGTVTGMGRGPGNAKTEFLLTEFEERRGRAANLTELLALIRKHFAPMQSRYGWGTNSFYYLAGKHGIHPTFVQEMLNDARYAEEDVLAVISHLREQGGKRFSFDALESARDFYTGESAGSWKPAEVIAGREVLILGSGPGVAAHRNAIESYIAEKRPFVIALNTQTAVEQTLIDLRSACHPVRLLADCEKYAELQQPLVTPVSLLPDHIKECLSHSELLDFGITVRAGTFEFYETQCVVPKSLVIAYSLAIATSGRAERILLAGFDGYPPGDPRNEEMDYLLDTYEAAGNGLELLSITPTRYKLVTKSVYAL